MYLTQKALKLSEARWQALEDSQQEELLGKELWIKENCDVGPVFCSCTACLFFEAHTVPTAYRNKV